MSYILAILVAVSLYSIGKYLKDDTKNLITQKSIATVIGIIFLVFLIWIFATFGKDFSLFEGSGGNPYDINGY